MPSHVLRAIRSLRESLFADGNREAAVADFVRTVGPDEYFELGVRWWIIAALDNTKAARWLADDIEGSF